MSSNIEFFEASSMHHALLLVNQMFGDEGIILSYDQINAGKYNVIAVRQIPDMDNICLQIFSKVITLLRSANFSKSFINRAYKVVAENIKKLPMDVESFLTIIFERLASSSKSKNKTFIFIGSYGVGKTTIATKFIKNCEENGIHPNAYYLEKTKDIGIYTFIMHLQNFKIKPQSISFSQLQFLDYNSINVIDSQSIQVENDAEIVSELLNIGGSVIYVLRSDQNIEIIKNEIILLKKLGVENFVINHFFGDSMLCNMVSFLVDNDCKLLNINSSRIYEEDFSLNVPEKLTELIVNRRNKDVFDGKNIGNFN